MSVYIWIILGTAALMYGTNQFISDSTEMLFGATSIGAIAYLIVWLKKRKRVSK